MMHKLHNGYVLEGEFLIKVGDTIHEVKTGDNVFGPRCVPHAFKTNDGTAVLLMAFQPVGKMEGIFISVSEGRLAKMSSEVQNNFKKAHGFEKAWPH